MTLDQYVAKRVRTLRKEFHLTQEQLAEAASIDISSIAKIERGERSNIKVNTLEKIVEAFGLPIASFFEYDETESENLNSAFEKFQLTLSKTSHDKQRKYLALFEEIIKVEQ